MTYQPKGKKRTSPFHVGWAMRTDGGAWRLCNPVSLTRRHLEVMRMLASGVRQKEIAAILKISPKTVGAFVFQLKTKFECTSTEQLFLVAIELYGRRGQKRTARVRVEQLAEEFSAAAIADKEAEQRLWK